jgi:hypothetical protein
MKHLSLSAMTCLLLLTHASAQTSFERLSTFFFQNQQTATAQRSDGTWLCGHTCARATYVGEAGNYLYVNHLSADGQTELNRWPIVSPIGYELIGITQVIPMQDGGFVVVAAMRICDVFDYDGITMSFDANGMLEWYFVRGDTDQSNKPIKWTLMADGSWMGLSRNSIYGWKLDMETGAVLLEFTLPNWGGYRDEEDRVFDAETEDIFRLFGQKVQRLTRNGASYSVVEEINSGGIYEATGLLDGQGNYYLLKEYQDLLYHFQTSPLAAPVEITLDDAENLDWTHLSVSTEGLVLAGNDAQDSIQIWLLAPQDSLLTHQKTIGIEHGEVLDMGAVGQQLYVTGTQLYGPIGGDFYFPPFRNRHSWMHVSALDAPSTPPRSDVALEAVVQGDSLYYTNQQWVMRGGDFSMTVKNTGTDTLRSVWIHFTFPLLPYSFICPTNFWNAQQHFDSLSVPPGGTTTVHFGDIYVGNRPATKAQLCFWATAPNDRVDTDQVDNLRCENVFYTYNTVWIVPTDAEPALRTLHVQPNPVVDQVQVTLPDELAQGSTWFLRDTWGRVIRTGSTTSEPTLTLDATTWPSGVYVLHVTGCTPVRLVKVE